MGCLTVEQLQRLATPRTAVAHTLAPLRRRTVAIAMATAPVEHLELLAGTADCSRIAAAHMGLAGLQLAASRKPGIPVELAPVLVAELQRLECLYDW